ncbi:TPR_REGION domain-containing protein [Durusdinium trenchii]|uniref:TPR_REGION domain-containing protein n=1 Tax=Durusdinium trenchii TaxID=1381693 RepID=A0ABP0SBL7_9DINO
MVSPPSSSRGVAPPSASPPRRARFEDEDRGRVGSLDARESSRTRISSRPPDDSRARKLSVTAPRRLLSSSGSLDLSPRSSEAAGRNRRCRTVLVQHRTDLCAPICDALALPDLVLESDVTVAGVRLRRGMQLVVPKNASVLAKSLTRSRQKLLMGLKTMRSLVFMWPEYMDEEPDFMTWWWKCPACRFPYPVQAPEALSGVSLLRRALPGVDNFLDGPARDLWALSGLSLPAKPKQPHALREVNNRFGDVTAQCSCCGQQVGTSAYMCSSETGDLTVIRGLQQVFQQQDS